MLPITALYAGLLALTLVPLTMHVVRHRYRAQVGILDGGDEPLARAIRVHGNFIEYSPLVLILIAVLESNGAPAWQLHGVGGVFVVGRLAHAYGLGRSAGASAPRMVGMIATMSALIFGGLAAVSQYLST